MHRKHVATPLLCFLFRIRSLVCVCVSVFFYLFLEALIFLVGCSCSSCCFLLTLSFFVYFLKFLFSCLFPVLLLCEWIFCFLFITLECDVCFDSCLNGLKNATPQISLDWMNIFFIRFSFIGTVLLFVDGIFVLFCLLFSFSLISWFSSDFFSIKQIRFCESDDESVCVCFFSVFRIYLNFTTLAIYYY